MTHPRQELGATGEELAARTRAAAGLTILARNWRCAAGEIDLIAQEQAADYSAGGHDPPMAVHGGGANPARHALRDAQQNNNACN